MAIFARVSRFRPATQDQTKVVRVVASALNGALGVFPDCKRRDDEVVEDKGAAVLLVGQEIADRMQKIDYEEDEPGAGLVIRRD